jgi:CcmD family protein
MPDTFSYMIAGYAVFWIVTFAFVISLWARTRNLQKEVDVLQQLAEGERHSED